MTEKFWTQPHRGEMDQEEIEEGILDYESIKREMQTERESDGETEFVLTTDFLEKYGQDAAMQIYEWYSAAIQRRDREPLEEERFLGHFFEGGSSEPTFMYGSRDRGYYLGIEKYGVFVPTHFAPKGIKSGYKLTVGLGEDPERPSVMAITEDLRDTIVKLPCWHEFDLSFLSQFRGETIPKKIVYNNHPGVQQLMIGLTQEYMEEQSRFQDYADSDEVSDHEEGGTSW